MKLALIGYGKMGKLIEEIALSQGHEITIKSSQRDGLLKTHVSRLQEIDVGIDFSHPSQVLEHVQIFASCQKPLIIGTTGWEEMLPKVKSLIEEARMGCLYAPNFSIGANLFMQIVSHAAELMNGFEEYDIGGVEFHHRQKLDTPSGTAKALAKKVMEKMVRVNRFEFASVRCGQIPGTHTIEFDSAVDTITLTHQARSREGFARGALKAAEWIIGKQGFCTMEDLILFKD